MSTYFTIVTNAGRAKLAAAVLAEDTLLITEMAVGDSGGVYVAPTADRVALVNEIYRDAVGSVAGVDGVDTQLQADFDIPGDEGGFTVREIGLFLDDGTLFAYGAVPATYKPTEMEGSTASMTARMVVDMVGTDATVLNIEAVSGMASQDWVTSMFRRLRHSLKEVAEDEYTLVAGDEAKSLVWDTAEDVIVHLPQQDTLVTPEGATYWLRNRGGGRIWLIPEGVDYTVEGDGNFAEDGSRQIELRLEKAGATNRWVSIGAHLITADPSDIVTPPLVDLPIIGYNGVLIRGFDEEPLQYYGNES